MIGQTISHYKILKKIGAGGMGEVYLAEDTILNRRVAIKVLPNEYTRDEERLRRFKQEAQSASALNHPNIVTVHEFGEQDGHQFIVTEFIDGETLVALIRKDRRIKLNNTLDVITQVASALTAAHEAGIVHRDIKPANVMIRPDGYVKVLDFGLAKLIETTPPQAGDTNAPTQGIEAHTETGVVLGTAPYMSPEQARGIAVDARTDIWSLGCLLYEMLSGRSPFAGQTVTDTLAAILEKEPPPLATEPAIPTELNWIIQKTLRKNKDERYGATKELLKDLQHLKEQLKFSSLAQPHPSSRSKKSPKRALIFGMLGVVVISGLLLYLWKSKMPASNFRSEIKSLAVLPLENLSGDSAQEYFADGMTEELIGKLAQIGSLRVISRTSVMRYKTARKSIPEIAEELNVDGIIEGTLQRSAGRVRVTLKLIQVATDSPLWVRDYERDGDDVLKLQGDIARAVADEIMIQISPEERARLTAAGNIDPRAHEAYLRGRHHLRPNEEDSRKAIEYFERAIQIAPDYAAAYGSLAEAWNLRGIWGVKNFKETKPIARKAALKALQLDPRQLHARMALGWVKMFDWDWTGAEEEFLRALDTDRNSADAHRAYGDLLSAVERHAEAIREMQRADELDPLSSVTQSRYARALYRARKYEQAFPHVKRAMELDPSPGNVMPYWILAELYAQTGRYNEAIHYLTKAKSQGGNAFALDSAIAATHARMGNKNEARRMLKELKNSSDPEQFANVEVAFAYTALGEKDEAFKVLFHLVDAGSQLATHLRTDPPLESLHSDPRWKELLRRMNFPQ